MVVSHRSWIFLFILVSIIPSAHARLGEKPVTGSSKTLEGKRYVIHTSKTSEGLWVTEYAIPDNGTPSANLVFGVAWQGMFHPDFTEILGSRYHKNYKAEKDRQIVARRSALRDPGAFHYATHKRGQGRNNAQFISNEVVLETWGNMRNLGGRAFSPQLLETLPVIGGIWGVTSNQILGVAPDVR